MRAFHNDPAIKEKYINRLKDHYKADEIIKGTYWENGKGCAVGCTIHSSNRSNYETELGIPQAIARIEDRIFENLPNKLAREFPLKFLSAIAVGADLSKVWNYFAIWLLTDAKYGVLQYVKNKKVVQDVADAYEQDMISPVSIGKWKELRKNAVAAYAIADAATAAVAAYAIAAAATTAAYAAAYAAAAAADSTAYAAAAAADSTANANGVNDSTYDGIEWYIAASQKLIELLKEAKP